MAKRATSKETAQAEAARKLAIEAARIAEDSNSAEVLVLDLRGISPVTDYFVIATGTSGRQMRSVADDVCQYGKSIGQSVYHVSGADSPDWIVVDFVDVVVHLFSEQFRHYYDLELIWGEAPRVRWRRPARKKPAEAAEG